MIDREALGAAIETELLRWVNLEATPPRCKAVLDLIAAAPAVSSGLDVERLARALFAALGWPTRRSYSAWPGGRIQPFSDGLTSGDGDNPEWLLAAAAVAREYDREMT